MEIFLSVPSLITSTFMVSSELAMLSQIFMKVFIINPSFYYAFTWSSTFYVCMCMFFVFWGEGGGFISLRSGNNNGTHKCLVYNSGKSQKCNVLHRI